MSGPGCALDPFTGKFSLSFFPLSGDPTVWVAISRYLPRIVLRAFRPGPYPKHQCCSRASLFSLPWLVSEASIWAAPLLAVVIRCVFYGLFVFFSQLCCPLRFQTPHKPTCESVSSFTTLSPGWVFSPNFFVYVFVFYILYYLLLKRMGCLSGCWCPS